MPSTPTVSTYTPSNAGVRFSWGSDPKSIVRLLKFVSAKAEYKHAFFPSGHTQIAKRYLIAQKACIEFLAKDPWIRDAERRGLVCRTAHEKGAAEWEPTAL
ncbi:hypothetical protein I317_06421 [Kwoniella heveanensis CBS 569]|nr:hypothetical protein I317_06421 [Kwoniella heveanensis CBS 569]